jgi:hypothetical protein
MTKKQPSFWQAANKMTQDMKQAIAKQASQAGVAMSKTASDVKEQLRDRATDTAKNLTEELGKKADQAGQTTQTWIDQINQGKPPESSAPVEEVYHVFIGYELAQKGGYQKVTLKSGKSYDIKINAPLENGCKLRLRKCGLQGVDAYVVFHTLFDESVNIYRQINQPIAHSSLQPSNKTKCSDAYSVLNAGRPVENLRALDLLDLLVLSGNLPRNIFQRYIIGSQNSRLIAIEECLEETLASAYLTEEKKRLIKGSYQCVLAGEALPNLAPLHQLDAILVNSYLFPELIQQYLIASATSCALTVDYFIEQLISQTIPEKERETYRSLYQTIRDGEPVEQNEETLKLLDRLIFAAEIPRTAQVIYQLTRDRFFEVDDDFEVPEFLEVFKQYQKAVKFVEEQTTQLNHFQVTVEPRERRTSFSGNSVAEGKLGLLGEPAFPKMGIGLIRAGVLYAIASVLEMETQEKIYLGISQPETSECDRSIPTADIYYQIMAILDGAMYPQLSMNNQKLGGFVGNFIPGQPDKQRLLRELEERLDS